jgi:hypothetical protein
MRSMGRLFKEFLFSRPKWRNKVRIQKKEINNWKKLGGGQSPWQKAEQVQHCTENTEGRGSSNG